MGDPRMVVGVSFRDGSEMSRCPEQQTMRVYLRVRPFSKEELAENEDQGCVVIENSQTVTLNAPKGSATMKSSEKGIGMSIHKFSFSQIFGPESTQAELFEDSIKNQVCDYLDGKNELIFSYGVTNAGKTYTIQGTPKDPGILLRVLDATFQYIGERQYEEMDLKPYLRNDAKFLDPDKAKQEGSTKAAIFASIKDDCDLLRSSGDSESLSGSSTGSSLSSLACSQTGMFVNNLPEAGSSQFALWVAYFEIYNECIYDLLQPSLCSKSKKRSVLRICDDGDGNTYVKDVMWINIHTLEEACKVLHVGNKNRHAAATKMNHSSSRSHSIFSMKLLTIDGGTVQKTSEFSLCDLAGSERCNKTKTFGERLKEAGKINNSLLILGKCITALRNNQTDGTKNSYIPFRESKLTKLFQTFFCGKGRASMIVNINQCASTYDETLHVMKFSAIAKKVVQVIPDKCLEPLSPCLFGRVGKQLTTNEERDLSEELLDEDEVDTSLLPPNELVNIIESLRAKLRAELRRNVVQEIEIRKEMGDAMLQQILESEELRSRQIEKLKESYEKRWRKLLTCTRMPIKQHAYQCAMNDLEDDYVPLDEFITEQEKVEALQHQLSELQNSIFGTQNVCPVQTLEQSCQTESEVAGDNRYNRLHKEKCTLEKICEDKQQLIVSLEKRLIELCKTLQEQSANMDALQKKMDTQTRSIQDVLQQNADKDKEIASLKAELSMLTQKSTGQQKTKRGLLANIREAVTPTRTGTASLTPRKTVRTAQQ
ncbi:kinesin-like protein KIF20A [Thalassophryne amazonica]|uniref:kinesin-like protein KIF20A n=1 Tax=Thalassophryne amazonica TaxID=390379 RepID=UPI00147137F8|nr:kinesin-like protein KIF20A [Thalassophryne amazonica]